MIESSLEMQSQTPHEGALKTSRRLYAITLTGMTSTLGLLSTFVACFEDISKISFLTTVS